uniref:Uncharacterized protein n=1 Tax=viral metagenome TaxID=1070528 RepID=A0A6C0AHE7_9ZZZZ
MFTQFESTTSTMSDFLTKVIDKTSRADAALMKAVEDAVNAYSLKPGYEPEFDKWAKRVWNVATYHDFVRMADHNIALTSETDFEASCNERYRQFESHDVLLDRMAYMHY